MIPRISRWLLFIYTFIVTFVVLNMTLYLAFYMRNQKRWLAELFRTQTGHVPLIFYTILIAGITSILMTVAIFYFRKNQFAQLEGQIRYLAMGNYQHEQLNQPLKGFYQDEYSVEIDRDIQALRQKMIQMSAELQELTSQPKLIEGESKEAILEEERHRLARELHDSVSQQLFASTMMLSALNEVMQQQTELPVSIQRQVELILKTINEAQSEMRALLLHLRPVSLEGKSLAQGIIGFLKELKPKVQLTIYWEVEEVGVAHHIEDHLFRIVQEVLSNTLRHAQATSLDVFLKRVERTIVLKIVDDGVGFEETRDQKVGSYGLKNIKERVAGMGGDCRIISLVDQGTSVEIKVPIIEECEEG